MCAWAWGCFTETRSYRERHKATYTRFYIHSIITGFGPVYSSCISHTFTAYNRPLWEEQSCAHLGQTVLVKPTSSKNTTHVHLLNPLQQARDTLLFPPLASLELEPRDCEVNHAPSSSALWMHLKQSTFSYDGQVHNDTWSLTLVCLS